jgi:hypothetical protein
MGITAEEATTRAARAQAVLNKEILTTQKLQTGVIKIQEELALVALRTTAASTTGFAKLGAVQAEIIATRAAAATKGSTVEVEANQRVQVSAAPVLTENELIAASYGLREKAAAGAAAVEVAANRAVTASGLGPTGRFGRLGKSISGSKISGIGLGAGIAATIAGEAIGGTAGGILLRCSAVLRHSRHRTRKPRSRGRSSSLSGIQ